MSLGNKKIILVTGSNRSGSTWVGKVIDSRGDVDNIIEPLNPNRTKRFGLFKINYWYPRLVADAERSAEVKEIESLFDYYLHDSLSHVKSLFRSYEGHGFLKSIKIRLRRNSRPIKLLKDPTALFAIPWLVQKYQVKPVVLIRHPAAYVLSIKEKNWWFDFNNFLRQENFFTGPMAELRHEVEAFKKHEKEMDIVANAALLWKVFYTQVKHYQECFPDWHFVTHEALSIETKKEFQKIFEFIELDLTPSVLNKINESTNADSGEEAKHIRNAEENAVKWKHKLNDEERFKIKECTNELAVHFYGKYCWE